MVIKINGVEICTIVLTMNKETIYKVFLLYHLSALYKQRQTNSRNVLTNIHNLISLSPLQIKSIDDSQQ